MRGNESRSSRDDIEHSTQPGRVCYEPRVLSLCYTESKVLVLTIWISVTLGASGVIALTVVKLRGVSDITFARNLALNTTSYVLSLISLIVLTTVGAIYIVQLLRALRHGVGHYQITRDVGGRHILLTLGLLASLWLTCLFSLIPTALVRSTQCWFNAYVTDTVWRSVQWLRAVRDIMQSTFFAILCIQINEWVPVCSKLPRWIRCWTSLCPTCSRSSSSNQQGSGTDLGLQRDQVVESSNLTAIYASGLRRYDEPSNDSVLAATNASRPDGINEVVAEGKASGADPLPSPDRDMSQQCLEKEATEETSIDLSSPLGSSEGLSISHAMIVADGSWLHHAHILLVWLMIVVFAMLMAVTSGNLDIHFDGLQTLQQFIDRLTYVFGQTSHSTWTRIANDPNAVLGNTTVTLKVDIHGTYTNKVVWEVTWTSPQDVPECTAPTWDGHNICVNMGMAALWQIVSWFYTAAVPLITSFCASRSHVSFDQFYTPVHYQLREFRAAMGLPPTCSSENDPTCSPLKCAASTTHFVMFVCMAICYCFYVILFLLSISKALALLKTLPYMRFRLANIMARLQLRESLVVMLFSISSLGLLAFVKYCDCNSALTVITGIVPVQLVCVALTTVKCYYTCLRASPTESLINNEKLSQFAWTEEDVPKVLQQRGFPDKPLFVMETALKMLYFSTASYHLLTDKDPACNDGARELFDARTALEMEGLTHHTIIRDRVRDAELIAGWTDDLQPEGHLVIAFRGTTTMKNVLADAQAWPVRHYDPSNSVIKRNWLCNGYGKLHQGFAACWLSVRDAVLALLKERIAVAAQHGMKQYVITLTGHSLGGAICTLAAWDTGLLVKELNASWVHVRCYTFGSPRPGNHAFAKLYKQLVPDTWDVANDQDVVPKMTKWMRVYKRTGNRVFIRKHVIWRNGLRLAGDIIVCPSWVELNALQKALQNSIVDHRLAAYAIAFVAITAAQFDPYKALDGGLGGARKLLSTPAMQHLLQDTMAREELSRSENLQLALVEMLLPPAANDPDAPEQRAEAVNQLRPAELELLHTVSRIGARGIEAV